MARKPLDEEDQMVLKEIQDAFQNRKFSDRVNKFMTDVKNNKIHKDKNDTRVCINIEDAKNWCRERMVQLPKNDFGYVSLYLFLSNGLSASQGEFAEWFNSDTDVGDRYRNYLWDWYKVRRK